MSAELLELYEVRKAYHNENSLLLSRGIEECCAMWLWNSASFMTLTCRLCASKRSAWSETIKRNMTLKLHSEDNPAAKGMHALVAGFTLTNVCSEMFSDGSRTYCFETILSAIQILSYGLSSHFSAWVVYLMHFYCACKFPIHLFACNLELTCARLLWFYTNYNAWCDHVTSVRPTTCDKRFAVQ